MIKVSIALRRAHRVDVVQDVVARLHLQPPLDFDEENVRVVRAVLLVEHGRLDCLERLTFLDVREEHHRVADALGAHLCPAFKLIIVHEFTLNLQPVQVRTNRVKSFGYAVGVVPTQATDLRMSGTYDLRQLNVNR